jgi:hypothetical protein
MGKKAWRKLVVRWDQLRVRIRGLLSICPTCSDLSLLTSSVYKVCSACPFGNQNRQLERYTNLWIFCGQSPRDIGPEGNWADTERSRGLFVREGGPSHEPIQSDSQASSPNSSWRCRHGPRAAKHVDQAGHQLDASAGPCPGLSAPNDKASGHVNNHNHVDDHKHNHVDDQVSAKAQWTSYDRR